MKRIIRQLEKLKTTSNLYDGELIVAVYHIIQGMATYALDYHFKSLFVVSISNGVFLVATLNESQLGKRISVLLCIFAFIWLLWEVEYTGQNMTDNLYGCYISIVILVRFMIKKNYNEAKLL